MAGSKDTRRPESTGGHTATAGGDSAAAPCACCGTVTKGAGVNTRMRMTTAMGDEEGGDVLHLGGDQSNGFLVRHDVQRQQLSQGVHVVLKG